MAIAFAALLNFAGAFISVEVARTIASDVVDAGLITPTIVFAGLIGAISWNLDRPGGSACRRAPLTR